VRYLDIREHPNNHREAFVRLDTEVAMPGKKLKDFLDQNDILYTSIMHSPAYTAQGIAHSAHISGKEIAKTVIVKVDGAFAMAVMPANRKLVLEILKDKLGAKEAALATESEFANLFPDCEPGAMPPFGNLYGMAAYSCAELERDEEIAFNAGTHSELVRMAYKDFRRLVNPKVVDFTR